MAPPTRFSRRRALQLAASAGFLVIGGRLLLMAGRGEDDGEAESAATNSSDAGS